MKLYFSSKLIPIVVGASLAAIGVVGLGYADYSRAKNLMTSVQSSRICLQAAAQDLIPKGHRMLVDNYEQAYGELLQAKQSWKGASGPLEFAALQSRINSEQRSTTYSEYEQLIDKVRKSSTLVRCANDLAQHMEYWQGMAASVKGDKLDHHFRMYFLGPGYFQDWPVYIVK